jgi:hypothetical protein
MLLTPDSGEAGSGKIGSELSLSDFAFDAAIDASLH